MDPDNDKCVNILILAGDDVNTQNSDSDTALILTVGNGRDKCVEELIAAGADVNI